MARKRSNSLPPGSTGPFGIADFIELVVAGDVGPEAGRVTDEDGIGAGLQRAFKGVDAAAVPPVGAGIAVAGGDGVVDVDGDRQAFFAAEAEETQRVGVVVEHAQLDFAADLDSVNLNCGLELVDGFGAAGVGGVAEDEAFGRGLFVAQAGGEWDGVGESVAEMHDWEVARRVVLVRRAFPGEQPGPVDAEAVHVGQKPGEVVAVPIGVVVGVDDGHCMFWTADITTPKMTTTKQIPRRRPNKIGAAATVIALPSESPYSTLAAKKVSTNA